MPGAGVPSDPIIYYISNICRMSGEETGMTLDGKDVIDTFKEYGDEEARMRRMRELGDVGYCEEFLETVKKNYAKALLPPVPKGILKLPSAFRQGD